jgi:hypothetical protein
LVADLVAEGVDATVSQTVRETVGVIRRLVDEGDDDAVSLGPIAEELKLDKSAASRRVSTAIRKGFVKNLEDRRGKPGRYVPGDEMPDDVVVLPTPEEVLQRCSPLHEGMQHSNPRQDADEEGSVAVLQSSEDTDTPPAPHDEWGEV